MHNSRWSHNHHQQQKHNHNQQGEQGQEQEQEEKRCKHQQPQHSPSKTSSASCDGQPSITVQLELPKVRCKAIFSTGWKFDELVVRHPEFIHIPWFHHGFIHWPNTETVNGTKCWCHWDAREDNSDCSSMAVDNACGHRPASPAFEDCMIGYIAWHISGYVSQKSNFPACIFGTPLAVRGFSLLP